MFTAPLRVPLPTGGGEARRARFAVAAATIGIAAMLFAYAISPGVRHVVKRAEHSVGHAVGRVLDRDRTPKKLVHAVGTPTVAPQHPSTSAP